VPSASLVHSVLSLQRSIGNAGVVRLVESGQLSRQPRDPWEENQPPETGRQTGEEPGMTGCKIVRKDGGWEVKCGHESGRSTPGIPLDPSKWGDMVPKEKPKTPLGPLVNPSQGPWLRRPPSLAEICERNPKAPVCLKPLMKR
jgi:hypothetical protein